MTPETSGLAPVPAYAPRQTNGLPLEAWATLPLCIALALALAGQVQGGEDLQSIAFFESKVRPLLLEHCCDCHGATKQKGGLRLDTRTGWQRGGDRGPAIVPGTPAASLLLKAVSHADPNLQMPPKSKLEPDAIAILTQWIEMGAPDPRTDGTPGTNVSPRRDTPAAHWAYQPVVRPTVPRVDHRNWPRGPIDRFVLAGHEMAGVRPVMDADRATWLRRVTLDLTGLPPTAEEIDQFNTDTSPIARERVVDRLLASAAFGERWARHWLDLVGYADQLGTVNDVPAPHAWRYRDYVIRALNQDKPFDRFMREQVAGDLLPCATVEQRQDALIATGFLLLGEIHIVTGDKTQLRADIVDHQIQKVGLAFLGQSLGCARCHDHKFDPIALEDYYGMAGIFGSTQSEYVTERGVWSSILSTELPETDTQREQRERELNAHRSVVASLKSEREKLKTRLDTLNREITNAAPASPTVATAGSGDTAGAGGAGNGGAAAGPGSAKSAEPKAMKAELEKKIAELDNRLLHLNYIEPKAAYAYAVRDADRPGDGKILIRGQARSPGRTVPRGFVRAIGPANRSAMPGDASGRRELADWLSSAANPLPARVTVNRIWQRFFGDGLVRSVDYWGTRGERPTHPELLDWLASEFIAGGWSQKKLIRQIVLSRTYGLSSVQNQHNAARDPDNRLLWRMTPRRLDAEALRDSVLAASGMLQPSGGGPALALHLVENVGGLDPKDVNPVSFRTTRFPEEQHRLRTLYLPVVRSRAQPGPAELRNLFDFIPPTEMAGARPATSVPTQALFLMNGEFLKTHARRLAEWLLAQPAPTESARLDVLYLRTLGRPARPDEAALATAFLATPPEHRLAAWTAYCHALFSSNEFLFRL